MPQSTTNRLARNVMFMYIRMFVLMLISLYTSRIVLRELGVDDYGIYNLVASIIAVFNSLRVLFASSIQRFMNTEMGKGNSKSLQLIFNIGTYINIILSIIFVISVEILGYWFFNYEINIDPTRLFAAQIVFQLSLLSAVISIMMTSFDAAIIAHEKMDFYAYSSILDAIFKLLIVYLLAMTSFDKLIFLAILNISVTIIMGAVNIIYCKYHFKECRYVKCWDYSLFRQMTSFAGWQFFGNTAFALTQNGLNMVLNIFGGAAVNAARGVSVTVNNVLSNFLSNIFIALNPHCMKLYAEGKIQESYNLLFFMSKVLFTLQCCLAIPFIFFTYEILSVWLTVVPDYSVIFLRLILIWSVIRSLHAPIDTLFKAAGNIKFYQLAEGLILSSPVWLSYIALSLGMPVYIVFVISGVMELINLIVILLIAKKVLGFNLYEYVRSVILSCLTIGIVFSIALFLGLNESFGMVADICIAVISLFAILVTFYYWGLTQKERVVLTSLVIQKFRRNRN